MGITKQIVLLMWRTLAACSLCGRITFIHKAGEKSVAYFFGAPSAIRKVSIVGFVLQWREEKLIDAHTISQVPSETVMHMLLFRFLLLFLLSSSSSACPWQRLRQRKFVYGAQSVCMCVYVDLSVYVPFSTQLNSYSTNTLTHTHTLIWVNVRSSARK